MALAAGALAWLRRIFCLEKFLISSFVIGCWFSPLARLSLQGILERCCRGCGRGDLIRSLVARCWFPFRSVEVARHWMTLSNQVTLVPLSVFAFVRLRCSLSSELMIA